MKLSKLEMGLLIAGIAGFGWFMYSRDKSNLANATANATAFQNAYNSLSTNFVKLYNNSPDAAKILAQ